MCASAGIQSNRRTQTGSRGGDRMPAPPLRLKGARAMTLLDPIPAETLREASIPVLETERLKLRAPRLEDAGQVAMLANDRRIAENTARIPHPYALADAQTFLAAANRSADETTLLITLPQDQVIGICALELREGPAPELGYWLGVPYWGRGYATEAVRALIDHAFAELGHDRPFPARARHLGLAQELGRRPPRGLMLPHEGCARKCARRGDVLRAYRGSH